MKLKILWKHFDTIFFLKKEKKKKERKKNTTKVKINLTNWKFLEYPCYVYLVLCWQDIIIIRNEIKIKQ